MTVHAAYYIQDGMKETITNVSQWGSCWAYFQAPNRKYNPKGGSVELHILIRLEHESWPAAVAFVESDFFKRLTHDTVTIKQLGVGTFNGERLTRMNMDSENFAHIVCSGDLGASRFITAMRLLTYCNKVSSIKHLPQEHLQYVPFAFNAINVKGVTYSDSGITMYPVTNQMVIAGFHASNEDSLDDIYMESMLAGFSESDWDEDLDEDDVALQANSVDAELTLEALARVWNRPDEEFEERCHQKGSIFRFGYWKDDACANHIDIHDDKTFIVTISAPITDVPHEGETKIGSHNLKEVCAYLHQHANK